MLASRLVKTGACVHVIMTQNATNFINPITFETLTRNKCIVDTFDRNFEFKVEHVALAQKADVIMVAPATANVIAKLAHGLADDMLTTTILASKAPKIIAPAMNTGMYENPVTQDNLKLLEKYGMEVITPANGWLACGDVGAGKMPEPEDLFEYILKCIACKKDLRGKKGSGHRRSYSGGNRSGALYHQSFLRENGYSLAKAVYASRCRCNFSAQVKLLLLHRHL